MGGTMSDPHRPTGYTPNPEGTRKFVQSLARPTLATAGPDLVLDESRDVVLYPHLLRVRPGYTRKAQAIGSCVGHGYAMGVDLLSAVQIAVHGFAEDWPGRCLEASIYGFSRVEARNLKINPGGDGSYGGAASKAVMNYGTLHYDVDYAGEIFTEYSGLRESQWGRTGVPDKLEKFAAKTRVKSATLIESWEDYAKACIAGYPTAICSQQGFVLKRDRQGFCSPSGTWSHCMLGGGARFGSRPGGLIYNSWGANSNSGPHYSGNPDNPEFPEGYFLNSTFWVDADVLDRMLRAGDSFALSSYDGFPPRKMPDWGTEGIL
jgi:hypothetical protein